MLIALAIAGDPSSVRAPELGSIDAPATARDDAPANAASERGTPWGPIVAGCLGVFFGAAIAAWQIRGRSKDA